MADITLTPLIVSPIQNRWPKPEFRSLNGTYLAEDLGDQRRSSFSLEYLDSDSNWETLMTLFRSKQRGTGLPTTLTWDYDGTTYTGYFAAAPKRERRANDLYRIVVEAIEE